MRLDVLWSMLCIAAVVQPSHTQDTAAATPEAVTGSIDPDDPNFDIVAALAELKARSVRLRAGLAHTLCLRKRCDCTDCPCVAVQAAGISKENQADTMKILSLIHI